MDLHDNIQKLLLKKGLSRRVVVEIADDIMDLISASTKKPSGPAPSNADLNKMAQQHAMAKGGDEGDARHFFDSKNTDLERMKILSGQAKGE